MSRPAVTVEGLGKRYRLGLREAPHRTFREALAGVAQPGGEHSQTGGQRS